MHRFSETATELWKQKPKCLNDDNVVKDDGLGDKKVSDRGLETFLVPQFGVQAFFEALFAICGQLQ